MKPAGLSLYFASTFSLKTAPAPCGRLSAGHESWSLSCAFHFGVQRLDRVLVTCDVLFLALCSDQSLCCLCAASTVWAWCCWCLTTWWSSCSTLHVCSTSATRTSRKGIDEVRLGNNRFCFRWAAPLSAKNHLMHCLVFFFFFCCSLAVSLCGRCFLSSPASSPSHSQF